MIKLRHFCYDRWRDSKKNRIQNKQEDKQLNPYEVLGRYCGDKYDKFSAIEALMQDADVEGLDAAKVKIYIDVLWYAYTHEDESILLSFVRSKEVRYLLYNAPISGYDIKQIVNSHDTVYEKNREFYLHELYFGDMYVAKHAKYCLRYNKQNDVIYLKRV